MLAQCKALFRVEAGARHTLVLCTMDSVTMGWIWVSRSVDIVAPLCRIVGNAWVNGGRIGGCTDGRRSEI